VPKRLFLTVLFVDDGEIDEAARFLSEVVGMGEPRWHDAPGANCALLFPGWPADVDSRRVVLGEGPGVVELIAVPAALRDAFPPGPALLSFATPDPDAYAARAAAAGFSPDEVFEVHGTRLAPIRVAGLPWQFTRFAE
jgi:hypothetical protein